MIIVYLQGGIGNQMFQYAAARRLALRLGVPLKLDLSRLTVELPGVTPRSYALKYFLIEAEEATQEETAALFQPPEGRFSRLARRLAPVSRRSHMRQHGFGFDPAVLSLQDNVLLDGYWQSERYFADVAGQVRSDFTLREDATGTNLETAAMMLECDSVSVHIRRGDYVSDPRAAAKYASCSDGYYRKAVDMVAQRVSRPRFFVFSDDPCWVKEHFSLPHGMIVVDHNDPDAAHEDLRLMSLCRHHIIANSSFSWWGAWLDPRPDKIVVAPARWFTAPSARPRDLVPESWFRVVT